MSIVVTDTAQLSGHNSVNGFVIVRGAEKFIAFVCEVFDATERKEMHIPDRDGTLIHSEVQLGDATLMVADAKPDWPDLPAMTQVYVSDAQAVLDRAVVRGGRVVTTLSPFWAGVKLARFADPWNNLWWLFEPGASEPEKPPDKATSSMSWQDKKPSYAYTSIMDEMARRGRK